ncbi:MAG: SulP family inorganic anion transporter [Nitrospinota bacterium]|nr:SulP family inorganic anion transporter [Nitrospinota bacterium]
MNKLNLFERFFPFLKWWHLVNRQTIFSDLFAGITNSFIVLPQGVAFAMIAGLPPEYGLYTAIVPPIVAGLFGSSLHLISGPTTAISIVIFSTVSPFAEAGTGEFIALVFSLTFLAGLIQFLLGIARMGTIVNFISHTVVIGFTAGAAILIATSQMKYCLGIPVPQGETFLHTWIYLIKAFPSLNLYDLAIALMTIALIIAVKKLNPRLPGMLIAMIIGSIATFLIGAAEHDIRLVGSIPSHLPPLSNPFHSLEALKKLSSGAFAVAMLGLIEAVSIARSVAVKSRQRIDGNQEFIGQGLANIVGSFFSCYASSGSFTRSGINYTAGAKTPVSAIFAALSLALIVLLFAPMAAYLPIAVMGGIVLVVAYNLIDFHSIKIIIKAGKSESSVLLLTFLPTLFLDLEFAIYVGIMFSLILYLRKTSKPSMIMRVPDPNSERRPFVTNLELPKCPQFKIIRIDGSIYFGSVNHIEHGLEMMGSDPSTHHLLIVCSGINFIDIAGAEMLDKQCKHLAESGTQLYFYGIKAGVQNMLDKTGHLRACPEKFFTSKETAIATIIKRLDYDVCANCTHRIFIECKDLPSPGSTGKN